MIDKESIRLEKVFKTKKKVLIATLYKAEPVMLATTKLGPDHLILLIDQEPTEKQNKSLELIKDSLGKVLKVEAVKTHGGALNVLDDSFKKDRKFILEAVKQHGYALEFADKSLKKDPDILKVANKNK